MRWKDKGVVLDSSLTGRTVDPLVIHWPKGFKARGEIQYHHCTGIVPTILESCELTMPDDSSSCSHD
jgi:arylsulfatase A-like enzyme